MNIMNFLFSLTFLWTLSLEKNVNMHLNSVEGIEPRTILNMQNGYNNNYGLADYWPASQQSLNLPEIVVTENHSTTLSIGVSRDVANDQSIEAGYDAFGAKASRGVNLGISGSYVHAYSVTEQYTRTNPNVSFGRNATNIGFNHIFFGFFW